MISTSSLKVMKSRRRNVSENTISLDNSDGESVGLRLMGSPLFSFLKKIPTEENNDSQELRSQPVRLFKGIVDVPPTSGK